MIPRELEFPDDLTSPETRMIVLPDGESRMIVASFISTQHQRVTEDGRTDGQTDGRTDSPVANTAVSIASYADAL